MDVFNRLTDVFGGSFAADAARITFALDPGVLGVGIGSTGDSSAGTFGLGVGMLVQNLQFNYQQQVTRIYEIGTNLSFYVAGRTQGGANLGRVLGPRPLALAFYRKYGDVCLAATNNLDLEMNTGCSNIGGYRNSSPVNQNLLRGGVSFDYAFTLKYCVIISIGVSITAQDMMINEALQIMFSSLLMRGVSRAGIAAATATEGVVDPALVPGGNALIAGAASSRFSTAVLGINGDGLVLR